jgi:hypothetical protein
MPHGMNHSNMQMVGAVRANAIVNSIGEGMANASHYPRREIGWPAMTIDLPLHGEAGTVGNVAAAVLFHPAQERAQQMKTPLMLARNRISPASAAWPP